MKLKYFLIIFFAPLLLASWHGYDNNWLFKKEKKYTIIYSSKDKRNIKEYKPYVNRGIRLIETFFNTTYNKTFNVIIHPDRQSIDSTWQRDWNMPEFKSECWMVASGIASKLDMISPKLWDNQSCEHIYSETKKTQQLITHELLHVYHGQINISPDFSNVEGIDWFIEGLATYASGQCDTLRIGEVKKAISENKIPKSLDNFWSGKIKYGLSGSVVMYIDKKYGREKLKILLTSNNKKELLSILKITETELLNEWRKYIQDL
ncbi:MAG: hypothetical protein JNK73_14495 [Bacteroidia bacterium]|nr:hypothetical protein [Bacteroidia bacterium]